MSVGVIQSATQLDMFGDHQDISGEPEIPWPVKPARAKLWIDDWVDLTERNEYLHDDLYEIITYAPRYGMITKIVNAAGCSLDSMCQYTGMDRYHLLRIDGEEVTKLRKGYTKRLCDFSVKRTSNKLLRELINGYDGVEL